MWPKGNIERQPPQETVGGIIMSIELNRRDFLRVIFKTAPIVAIGGKLILWPEEAQSRPVAEPAHLLRDDSSYLVDPYFDFCPDLPTFRELYSLENMGHEQVMEALVDEEWRFQHLVKDPDNWSVSEIDGWLDSQVEMDDMSPWKAMSYTQYGPGIRLHDQLGWKTSREIGLSYIEGEMPGHDFVGVRFDGDTDNLNRDLERLGMNLLISNG
jgi:hypothetical protein